MADDIRGILERAAAAPKEEPPMAELHDKARRSRVMRAVALATTAGALVMGSVAIAISIPNGDVRPLPGTTPAPTPTPSASGQEDRESRQLDWPEPFVPRTASAGNRELMSVVFPDKTAATLSYPSELRLAERGMQATISYTFEEGRPNGPHDIIFIPGDAPPGLLDPEPLETFDATPFTAALHAVTYERLRGDPPYALVYETEDWTIAATLPQREDAGTVARYLHPSVTADGWPSVFARGPIQLSKGFGEARGAHLEIGDGNPLFDFVDAGEDFTYIVMGLVTGCAAAEDGVSQTSGDSYGSKCLPFAGGQLGIFVSIYGPEQFVRAAYEGIELEQ